jgi:osmotically-inducible protein OsmY
MDYLPFGAEEFPEDRFEDHPLPETLAEAERLAASIERAVWRETEGRVRDLRVEVSGEGVLLTGRCTTYYLKQKAQHAAMRVPGGGPLQNHIEVS